MYSEFIQILNVLPRFQHGKLVFSKVVPNGGRKRKPSRTQHLERFQSDSQTPSPVDHVAVGRRMIDIIDPVPNIIPIVAPNGHLVTTLLPVSEY